ncbi:MAG: NTP transferase domain-containing protein [Fimbriimonadaceae bacterium]|nr:NTP transferase domain-containing protein [Fimbriimonadaceae bacterium]
MTVNRPKPLVPVANRPIMAHILQLLARHGLTEVVATLHYLAEEITGCFGDGSDYGVKLTYSLEPKPLGTAGSVKLAEEALKHDTFVIISGDALTGCDLTAALAWHKERKSVATLVLKRVPNPLDFGLVITDDDGRIQRFLEKPGWSEVFSDTVNTGIYILEPEVLDLIEPGENSDWSRDVFPKLLQSGASINGWIMDDYWSDIGQIQQYREAQLDLLGGRTGLEVPGREIQPGVWVGADTIIDPGVTFIAPVCIGADCRIKSNAVIGPATVIGDGCLVDEQAEIANSVVWESTYLGPDVQCDGAIVGSHCTIKRETVLRQDVVIGDNTLVDVGSHIKAKVKVWPNKMIERGSTLNLSLISGDRWRSALFRETGVAGLSNLEITPEFAVKLGLAFGSTIPMGARIVTARDSSRSSRMTKRALISSLLSCGITVVDMRSSPLPITRHHIRASSATGAISTRKMPGSSRLTVLEFFDADGRCIDASRQRKIEANFYREEFRRTDPDDVGIIEVASRAAELYQADFWKALGPVEPPDAFQVVVDYGYSSISPIFPAILDVLHGQALSLNVLNDARKAPRVAAEIQAFTANAAKIVSSLRADLGVLFLNEGERMLLIDDRGLPLEGPALLAAAATLTAESKPGARIALDVRVPDRLVQHLEAKGAEVLRTKVGRRPMIDAALDSACDLAGDHEGALIFPGLTNGPDAMFGLAQMLRLLWSQGRRLSDVIDELPEFYTAEASPFCPSSAKGLVMRVLAEEWARIGEIDTTDGLKCRVSGAWVMVLPDSFDPCVHIHAEADSALGAREWVKQTEQRIRELAIQEPELGEE